MKLRVLALVAVVFAALAPVSSQAFVAVSVGFAPPVLPVYEPGPVPVAGYIWTPGYWAWDPAIGYYWVPGAWVPPPAVGLYWTPPWWGFDNGLYLFHEGYWGPTVGFYGGINYGYGYFGSGYWGGRWDGGVFRYNTAVVRVNKTVIKNVYVDRSVLSRQAQARGSRASFNGPGGAQAQPTAAEKAAEANARKVPPTSQQLARREAAAKDPKLQAKANNGQVKADAIKAFNQTHQQRQAGAAKAAAGRETAATEKTKAAAGAEKRTTAGRETTMQTAAARQGESAQAAERRQRGAAERREAELRSTRARENAANAARQREMAERSRRPEVAPGRQVAATRRAESAPQQQRTQQQQAKKKRGKGQKPEGERY